MPYPMAQTNACFCEFSVKFIRRKDDLWPCDHVEATVRRKKSESPEIKQNPQSLSSLCGGSETTLLGQMPSKFKGDAFVHF